MAKVAGIFIGPRKGGGKSSVGYATLIAGHGMESDSHAGRDPNRQISLFANETLHELISEGFQISAEDLSTNILTENIQLDSLKPGMHLRIGETLIEIVEERKPCRSITRIDNRLPKRLYGKCGQLGRILKSGTVRPQDEIELLIEEK